jgi:hypothetical protein
MMKRRDFLVASAGVAGAAIPGVGFTATPCPPPSLNVAGGSSAATPCGSVSSEVADWLARSSGPGVVWSHNFDSATEANQFRMVGNVGNDPTNSSKSTCVFDADGFAGGGSLNCYLPTGGFSSGYWNRPMSALVAGANGKTTPDPAAGGTLVRRNYNPNDKTQDWNFYGGYYGHTAHQAEFPSWQGRTDVWDGNEFWVQFRAKLSGARWTAGNPSGKLMFIDITGLTGSQEIVIQSENNPGAAGDHYYRTNPFRMYTSQGSEPNSLLTNSLGSVQPGGPYASTCTISKLATANACWEWPKDEWVTVLVHVIPGRNNGPYYAANLSQGASSWPYHDMTIEAWVARRTETSYTKVYENKALAWDYWSNGHHPPAFNKIGPTAYMNAGANPQPAPAGWSQKFTQIIFSKQFIACPAV